MNKQLAMILAATGSYCGAYDDMGDDDAIVLAGYDDMGAARRRGRPGGRSLAPARFNTATTRQAALQAFQPDASGMAVDQVMPFPNGTFILGNAPLILPAAPQRSFQVRRLVIDRFNTGASATGLLQVTGLTVGADQQFTNTGAIPASMFSPTAVGVNLKPQAARPGITVTLSLSLTGALAGADTVLVTSAAVGPALG